MSKTFATTLAAIILGSSMAFAQMSEAPWTMEEFLAVYPEVTPEVFAQIDVNGDGLIDADELEAAIEAGLVEPAEG